jgi:hypothetical protein
MKNRPLPQGKRGYESLLAALTKVEDPRPPAFRRLEQALGGELARLLVGALATRRRGRPVLV